MIIEMTKHAEQRLFQRSSMSPLQLINIFTNNAYSYIRLIDSFSTKIFLIYSVEDFSFFVVFISPKNAIKTLYSLDENFKYDYLITDDIKNDCKESALNIHLTVRYHSGYGEYTNSKSLIIANTWDFNNVIQNKDKIVEHIDTLCSNQDIFINDIKTFNIQYSGGGAYTEYEYVDYIKNDSLDAIGNIIDQTVYDEQYKFMI